MKFYIHYHKFNPHVHPILMVIKKSHKTKWWMVTNIMQLLAILDIRRCELHRFVRMSSSVYNETFILKQDLFYKVFMYE